jgi:hypothetical protein
VLPTFIEAKSAYEFLQKLELIYRETARTPPVTDKAVQQGFLLVESSLEGARVARYMFQNLLSAKSLAKLRGEAQQARKEYAEEHLALYFALQRPFGLELPVEFTTDKLGAAAAPTGEGRPGKPKPAMPYEVLHFPFISPGLSNEDPAIGKTWKSAVTVRCGFGNFTLPYTGKWIARDLVNAEAEITFDPPTGQEKPAILEDIHLRFNPAGSWKVTFSIRDGAPMQAVGSLQYVVTATVPPDPEVTEVINARLAFQWRKVPLGFDNKLFQTRAWAALPPMSA